MKKYRFEVILPFRKKQSGEDLEKKIEAFWRILTARKWDIFFRLVTPKIQLYFFSSLMKNWKKSANRKTNQKI